ncbi:MAG: DUF924 domain-containing protein [Sphingomonadales bacterium]|nr:DUF924 domain-containing protein [Sphingomonadales bacterium]
MALAQRPWAAELLHVWFHRLRPAQRFARDDAVDAMLARRFGRALRAMATMPARAFTRDKATARAAILLFDQLSRNLHRGSARAFAQDRLARAILRRALARGWDRGLDKPGRQFLWMPLMHSEDRADQRLALRLYARLGDAAVLGFARRHAGMVARFGRFPHRNDVLGRRSTAAERRAVAAGNAW